MSNKELEMIRDEELKEEAKNIWEALSGYYDREEMEKIAHFIIQMLKGE